MEVGFLEENLDLTLVEHPVTFRNQLFHVVESPFVVVG